MQATRMLQPSYDEIVPGLFISNITISLSRSFLHINNIKLVVNCAKELTNIKNTSRKIKFINIPLYDRVEDNDLMYDFLEKTVDKIRLFHLYGNNVLVHCHMGISRSASVVVAYLIKYYNYNLTDAINFVISKRNIAFNGGKNIVFYNTLKKFEKKINRL